MFEVGAEIFRASYALGKNEKYALMLLDNKLSYKNGCKAAVLLPEGATDRVNLISGIYGLFYSNITYRSKDGKHCSNMSWLGDFSMDGDEGECKVCVSECVMPFLQKLSYVHRLFGVEKLDPLRSRHSCVLYDLIVMCSKLTESTYVNPVVSGKVCFKVKELMDIFDVPESFRRYNHFKNHAILLAIRELKEKGYAEIEFSENPGRIKSKVTQEVEFVYKLNLH